MPVISFSAANKWLEKAAQNLISAISFLFFSFLDLLDFILCIFYRFIDDFLEEEDTPPCYCESREEHVGNGGCEGEDGVSETLYGRKNIFRDLGLLKMRGIREKRRQMGGLMRPRWSDCGCDSCNSWLENGEEKLHLVVMEPLQAVSEDCRKVSVENVIFLHGFLSSSSLWTETVFPNLSETARSSYRLLAVDLLGFGRSPKPYGSLYRLEDHLRSIEKSIIQDFQLNSFHLVAHSMGCIIALALAAKYPDSVKSIALIAPARDGWATILLPTYSDRLQFAFFLLFFHPYIPSTKEKASHTVLNRLAERKIWPPLLFGSSVMSWYEHIGRSVCFLICRNHRTWEKILKLFSWKRNLHFKIIDLTRHTHHSAWHTMHNVICGGAKVLDDCLEVVSKLKVRVSVMQGQRDQVVPLECSYNVKLKVPLAEVQIISSADHTSVVLGREKDLTRDLELIWSSEHYTEM